MKRIIVIGLCAALVAAPVHKARSVAVVVYVCVVGAASTIGGYIYFKVKGCRPKYYCITDANGNRFYSNATRSERAANDWTVTGGPYDSAEEAAAGCVTSNPAIMAGPGGVSEVHIPQVPLRIWKSTNLVNWVLVDTILDDPDHFSWIDPNAISSTSRAFYRVSR
jgi:hypothetical protein